MKKRILRPEDLDVIRLVSDPKLSGSYKQVVYTVTHPSIDKNKYVSSIWLFDLESRENIQLIGGDGARFPEWIDRDKAIVYLSTIEKDLEKINEVRLYRLDTGSTQILYRCKNSISNIRVSKDNKWIMFIESVKERDEEVMVIETIPIWFNGKGFTYNSLDVIKIIDRYSENIIQPDLYGIDVSYAEFDDKASRIYFVGTPNREKPYITHLYMYDLDNEELIRLTGEEIRVLDFCLGINNKVVFRGQDFSHGLSTHRKLYLLDPNTGSYHLLTDIDLDIINAINCDVRGPSSSRALQHVDGWTYFPLSIGGKVALYRVNYNGLIESVIEGDFTVENCSVARDKIVLTKHDPINPPELYLYVDGSLEKLTDFNSFIRSRFKLSSPLSFRFRASDGEYIDGWIMKPPDVVGEKNYPTILYVHGGPATTFGHSFIYEFQVIVNSGFVLVYTNPRGSTGYSQEFKDIRGRYGERDYMDLMEAIDYVISNYEFIDPNRIGVTGGSYGGFMTNWIVGHTDRFRAAVTQRSICNWISKFGTTDIGFYFNSDQIAGELGRPYWEDNWFEVYWEKSPLKYVQNVKTPTLIIHSIEDYRCWVDQAIQFFTALKYRGIDTKLVLFPRENHDLSRTGRPKNRVERIKHILEWFKKYLVEQDK